MAAPLDLIRDIQQLDHRIDELEAEVGRLPKHVAEIERKLEGHKNELLQDEFSGRGKVEISRFKGLGEMPTAQLKATTMDPKSRTLLRVRIPDDKGKTGKLVEQLMGKKPGREGDRQA